MGFGYVGVLKFKCSFEYGASFTEGARSFCFKEEEEAIGKVGYKNGGFVSFG